MLDVHGGELVAVVGLVRDRDGDTARLSVARWLAGAGEARQVNLDDKDRYEAGALRLGVEYVVVAVPFEPPRDAYYLNDCMPAAPLDSREGQSLLGLVEHHFALPESDSATLPDLADPTFVVLGVGVANGLVAVAMMRRRRLSN